MTMIDSAGSVKVSAEVVHSRVRQAPVAAALFVACLGVLVQSLAYAAGWAGHERTAIVGFYVGLAVIVIPYTSVLTAPVLTMRQRLSAALAYGLLMYLSWYFTSPVLATRFDETLHVATLVDLAQGDGFFHANSMLPVSPHYPGLELAALSFHWLLGLPLVVCQALIGALSRTVLTGALFLIAARVGRTSRAGGIAVLLYSASPQFYFFNSQFSYQTVAVALTLAAVVLLMTATDLVAYRAGRNGNVARVAGAELLARWMLYVALSCLAALTLTHHLTSWLMLATLWVLTGFLAWGRERGRARVTGFAAIWSTLLVAAWTAIIAPMLIRYLGPIFGDATDQLGRLISMDGGQRQIGTDTAGTAVPYWQLGLMAAAVLMWLFLLARALPAVLRRRTPIRSRAGWLMVGIAAIYPLLLAVRSSPAASEIGDRASTFVAMAMAILIGVWLHTKVEAWREFLVPATLVLVVGGMLLGGGPDWQRVPGPYLPGAQQRSVDAQTVALARWAGRYLPAGSIFASDLDIDRTLPDFAPVSAATQAGGAGNMTPVFVDATMTPRVTELLRDNDVDFVIVDTRTVGHTVRSGDYYEAGSAFGDNAMTPTAAQFDKFDGAPGFRLIYDGPIKVYDVRGLRGEPQVFADRADPGLPGPVYPWQMGVSLLVVGALIVYARRRLDPRGWGMWQLLSIAGALPALMVVGAVAVFTGVNPWIGTVVLVQLCAISARALAQRPVLPPRPVGGSRTAAVLAPAAILTVAAVIAVLASYHALFGLRLETAPVVTGTESGASSAPHTANSATIDGGR